MPSLWPTAKTVIPIRDKRCVSAYVPQALQLLHALQQDLCWALKWECLDFHPRATTSRPTAIKGQFCEKHSVRKSAM